MNRNDISTRLRQDASLREAVRRQNKHLPPMSDNLNERLLDRIQAAEDKRRKSKRIVWLTAAIASAVAACALLLLLPGRMGKEQLPPLPSKPVAIVNPPSRTETQDTAIEQSSPRIEITAVDSIQTQPENPDTHLNVAEPKQPLLAHANEPHQGERLQTGRKARKSGLEKNKAKDEMAIRPIKENIVSKAEPEELTTQIAEVTEDLPDTLGNSIFQSPKNVLIAMRMLSECDEIISRETQEIRNDILEATFNVVPPSPRAILVKDENGDLNVMETNQNHFVEL